MMVQRRRLARVVCPDDEASLSSSMGFVTTPSVRSS